MPAPLDAREANAEQPDTTVGVDEGSRRTAVTGFAGPDRRVERLRHGRDQRLRPVGPALEEGGGGDAEPPTFDLLVVRRSVPRSEVVSSDHDHVGGNVDTLGGGGDDHQSIAGPGPDPDRDLAGSIEPAEVEHLVDQGVGDQARVDRDELVRPRGPESERAGSSGEANGRAVAGRVERRPEANVDITTVAEPSEAIEHDRPAQLSLEAGLGVLPVAATTTGGHVRAGRRPAARSRTPNPGELGLDPGSVVGDDRRVDQLTGQATGHEHHLAVGVAAECGTSGGDPVQFDLELWHHVEAMTPNQSVAPNILIVPSVLPADFSKLGDECVDLEAAGVDRIQFDVMDGRFVPNLTFGPDVIASVRPLVSIPFEAHLMIEEPDHLIPRFVEAGCETIIVHAETTRHLHRTLATIRELGASPSIALNPHTPLENVASVLDLCDMLLVMTVNPGFGGQAYLASMEPKIAAARALLDTADRWIDLEVDGGISALTITGAAGAGANVFISGSALYRHEGGLGAATAELRTLAEKAWADRPSRSA